jgi:hypothetical protein
VVIECTLPADAQAALACMPGAPTNVRGRAVAINADETRFAVADETDTVSIFDRAGRRLGEPIKVGGTPVSLGWAAAGGWLAVGSINGAVTIIDPAVPDAPIAQASLGGPVTALAWRPAGLQLAFACEVRDNLPVAGGGGGARRGGFCADPAPCGAWEQRNLARLVARRRSDRIGRGRRDHPHFEPRPEHRRRLRALRRIPCAVHRRRDLAGRPVDRRRGTRRHDPDLRCGSGALARTVRPAFESGIVALAYAPSGLLAAAHESDGITLVPSDTANACARWRPRRTSARDWSLPTTGPLCCRGAATIALR